MRRRRRSLALLPLLFVLGGCMSAEERKKVFDTPPPAHHATPTVRRAVAAMAVRTSKYQGELLVLALREPKFTAYSGVDPAFPGSTRTFYCVNAAIAPLAFGRETGLPVMEYLNATVRITDLAEGKTNLFAMNSYCGKEPTEPFSELIDMARSAVEAAKNRTVVVPVVSEK